jgi:AcrR family transcriptional regulator
LEAKLIISNDLETTPIQDVKPATQRRSRAIRDALIECGIDLLNTIDFDDLSIPALTTEAGCSVGTFYKRFENKERFLRVLRDHVAQGNRAKALALLDPDELKKLPFPEATDRIVDAFVAISKGRGRGVLKSVFIKLNSDPSIWDPMRETTRLIDKSCVAGLADRVSAKTKKEAATKVKLAVQMVGSTIINTIVEAWHPHVVSEKALTAHLKVMVRSYLEAD